jgi:hypothetical protein
MIGGSNLFATTSRPALGPTQPPIQWVPVAFSLGVKLPGREADQSPVSNAEVKNAWRCIPSLPHYAFMMCSVKNTGTTLMEFFFFQLASTVLIGPWPSLMDFSIHRHLVGFLGWGISPTQSLMELLFLISSKDASLCASEPFASEGTHLYTAIVLQ